MTEVECGRRRAADSTDLLGEPVVALELLEVGRMPSSRGVVDQGPMRL